MSDLAQFYDRVQNFDWFYEMSDDHYVWQCGNAAWAVLAQEAANDPEKKRIMDEWSAYHYSGEPWKTPKIPKPIRPPHF